MRFVSYLLNGTDTNLAVRSDGRLVALPKQERHRQPDSLMELVQKGQAALEAAGAAILRHGESIDEQNIQFLPPIPRPPKIICIGLNYLDHTKESKFEQPTYPTVFLRVPSSFVGHNRALIRPTCSEQFDYEGELVAYIGKRGRHISKENALEHVIGWSVSNEGSVRDYQFKSPQWTVGKNFDKSGSIGPDFVTADEVPDGGAGLKIETRLNGVTVQSATTSDMVFDVRTIISIISEAMTLEPGDVIVTGTPAGVGLARKPPLFMKKGDKVEVEVQGVGLLQNWIDDEPLADA